VGPSTFTPKRFAQNKKLEISSTLRFGRGKRAKKDDDDDDEEEEEEEENQ